MRLVTIRPNMPPTQQKKRRRSRTVVFCLGLVASFLVFLYFRPLPVGVVELHMPKAPAQTQPTIDWPERGQASIGAVGYDVNMSSTAPHSVSTASMAKVITVLTVLSKKPLRPGQTGPTITMTNDDVRRYQTQLAQNGSHLAVSEGETFTEYQMLEAILLPSANNMADSLAVWAFGSLEAYQKQAQAYVNEHGLKNTHIGPDASGFDPSTTSTTADLTQLGKLALENPVVMKVAGTKSVTFETAGEVSNTNRLLGGVLTGLKTGMNDGNSGGFIFTSTIPLATKKVYVTGAIVNAAGSSDAVSEAAKLATSMQDEFEVVTYAGKGQIVGTFKTPWGAETDVLAAQTVAVTRWRANAVWHYEKLSETDGTTSQSVGSVSVKTNGDSAKSDLVLANPVAKPSAIWRLTHLR